MSIAVRNPVAAQDPTTQQWRHTADLTLPDGSSGHLDMTLSGAQQQYFQGLVQSDVAPSLWANGPAGPISPVDVTRLLGVVAIGQQIPAPPPAAPTTYSGPDLTQ
jgi:hypothetical protein